MLGKLIKHEFKATVRLIPAFYAFLALMCGVLFLADKFNLGPIKTTAVTFLVIAIVAVWVVTCVVIVMRFHKNLFGNEGYLTGTLPVKSSQIMFSKGFAAAVWLLVSSAVALTALYFLINTTIGSPIEIIKGMGEGAPGLFLIALVMMGIQGFLMIAEIYFAITLANTRPFIKNNIGFSFLIYFAVTTVMSGVDMAALFLIPIKAVFTPKLGLEFGWYFNDFMALVQKEQEAGNQLVSTAMPTSLGIGSIVSQIIVTVVLFALSAWLLKKKTSVK